MQTIVSERIEKRAPVPDTMRAIDIRCGKGDRTHLFINSKYPRPIPTDGQVLVKIKAFGVNRMDITQREGRYPVPPNTTPILGVEFSGVVDSLGPGHVDGDFNVGDEVFGLAYGGAYAEYVAVSSKMLLHKPDFLTHVQCAAIPENWMTATQALQLVLGFVKGKSILWHAGASGVSTAGIQLSRFAGASAVYATAGSQEKLDFITERLGATAAFNYKTQDWAGEISKATDGKGVDYIVDFVGADYFQKNIDVAARDGRMVLLGAMSGFVADKVNVGTILYKRLRIEGSTLRSRDEEYQCRLIRTLSEHVLGFKAEELKIYIDTVMSWERIQEAHKHMEEARNSGKIVCTIP